MHLYTFFHGIYSAIHSYVTLVQLHIYVLIMLFVLVAGISLVILGDLGLAVISFLHLFQPNLLVFVGLLPFLFIKLTLSRH